MISTYNDEVRSHEQKPRGSKGAPCQRPKQEGSGDAGERETGGEDRRTGDEDEEVVENSRLPRGGRRLDERDGFRNCPLKPGDRVRKSPGGEGHFGDHRGDTGVEKSFRGRRAVELSEWDWRC